MKANLFSPILVLLIITLFAKASMLFGRIQEQTTYAMDTSASSILVNTAYAKTSSSPEKKHEQEDAYLQKSIKDPKIDFISTKTKNNDDVIDNFTRSEIDLLKDLAKRRSVLDKEKTNLNVREQVLKATENKIDKKVSELKSLQSQVENLLKKYDQKENSKIMSLVKIYETMKPKDAAKIFNELEMPVLLRVVSNMKEVKVAPIIASMNPTKARDLSIELSKQKPLD